LQKEEQMLKAIDKFNKHFKNNYENLKQEEEENPEMSGPKYQLCFIDLATYLENSNLNQS